MLLKGVLHPADATQAVAAGAAGVIVSNHGGRTLDTVPSTAVALPRVAQAVAGVAHVLRLLRDELEVAMALTGCKTLADAPAALSAD